MAEVLLKFQEEIMFGKRLHHGSLRFQYILATVALVLAGVIAMSVSVSQSTSRFASASETPTNPTKGSESISMPTAEVLSDMFRSAAEQVLPSVVEIKAAALQNLPWAVHNRQRRLEPIPFEETPEENDFEMDEEVSEQGLGCGVIIDPSGIVLTNCHVVEEANEMLVELPDGRFYKVKDARKDKISDLAVLSLDCAEPLPAVRLGDSENLRIGDWVLTIGSPFELEQTVSAGIISATKRSVQGAGKTRLLQTDAAINPGSSGGALVNLRGEVVGITTAIASRDGGYQGVGFAIPIDLAKWVVTELREHGRVRRGYLGVSTTRRSSQVANRVRASRGGALVTGVAENSPADKAGVEEKDIILSFDNRPVRSSSELHEIVEQLAVGSKHKLEILRNEARKTLEVTIDEESDLPDTLSSDHLDADGPSELVYSRDLELVVSNVSKDSANQLGLQTTKGVLVVRVDPGGAAFRAGVRKGMVIVRVGNRPASNTEDFAEIMDRESLSRGIRLEVYSDGKIRTISVQGS